MTPPQDFADANKPRPQRQAKPVNRGQGKRTAEQNPPSSRRNNAKKQTAQKADFEVAQTTKRRARKFPFSLLIAALLACSGLSYFIYSLAQVPPIRDGVATLNKPTASPPKIEKVPPPQPQTTEVVSSKDETKGKEFTFYDQLPKTEVDTRGAGEYISTPRDTKAEVRYILQAASFRNPADAEKMRVDITLLGLPNVRTSKSVNEAGGTWYRVTTGPFDNSWKLKKARAKLESIGISPLQVKAD